MADLKLPALRAISGTRPMTMALLAVVGLSIWMLLISIQPDFFILGIITLLVSFIVIYAVIDTVPRLQYYLSQTEKRSFLGAVVSTVGQKAVAKLIGESHALSTEDLPIAVLIVERNGRIKTANAAARKLLGMTYGEHVLFSDLVDGLGQSVRKWLEREVARKGEHHPQMLRSKRNSDLYLQVSLAEIPLQPRVGVTVVLTDATEMKSLKAQFVQSQKMQAIGQLAGGVAHDFNNLLTAISGYCDLLMLRHSRDDPDYGDLLQISQNSNRAAALVGQLLAFSRKQTLLPSPVDVDETLADLTHLLNRLVGEKINLRFDRLKNLPKAFVDGRQLEQVIMNLVVNSRDAMPEGGNIFIRTNELTYKKSQMEQKARVLAGRYVVIEVEDDGSGIPAEILPQIFDPFFSTKEVGEGTGLGLSTVYGIIKQTGGYVFANSEEGKGTVIRVLLPVAAPELSEKESVAKVATTPTTGLSRALILLAEDEDPVRTFAVRALKMQGATVLEAASGEEALAIAEEYGSQIDVVISDVIMPMMNGPTWVKAARAFCPQAKVIFVSGYAEDTFDDDGTDLADSCFLTKPFSLQKLIETVNEVLAADDQPVAEVKKVS